MTDKKIQGKKNRAYILANKKRWENPEYKKRVFVDGYLEKGNIVFEIDEKPKINQKDIERENVIKNELNCIFIRIPTW